MGLRPPPYNSMQGALIAKQIIMGDPADEGNPFAWDRIEPNFPGTDNYDASKLWIQKLCKVGKSAFGLAQYIDDLRIMVASRVLAWAASRCIAKDLEFLGLQDAGRKRQGSSQKSGAWAGAVVSSKGVVTKSVTDERWCKTQQPYQGHWSCNGIAR